MEENVNTLHFSKNTYWRIASIIVFLFYSEKTLAKETLFPHIEQLGWYWEGGTLLLLCFMGIVILFLYKKQQKLLRQQEKYRMASISQEALAYQMDQHFAFNTLNSIQRLILENNPQSATRYIAQFGKLIRNTLYQAQKNYLSIEEEIKSLELYLELELLRTKGRFQYTIDISPGLDKYNTEVPTGIFQPLLEYAIWYGLMPGKEKGQVYIRFFAKGAQLFCEIEDNGVNRPPIFLAQKDAKIPFLPKGIILLNRRLENFKQMTGESIQIEISASEEDSSHKKNLVRLKIPILRDQWTA